MTADAAGWVLSPAGRNERACAPLPGGSHVPRRGRAACSLAVAAALLAGAAPAALASSSSGRPTRRSLEARASAIAGSVAADQEGLQASGERYLAAEQVLVRDRQVEAGTSRSIARAGRRAKADRARVASAAVAAYVQAGSVEQLGLFFDGRPNQLEAGQAYLSALTGRLTSAVAALTADRQQLSRQLRRQQAATRGAKRALSQAEAARSSAIAGLEAEQRVLASVRGHLASLVAAEAAARARAAERAAERAARAAERAAEARAAATSTTSPPDRSPQLATAGPTSTAPPPSSAPAASAPPAAPSVPSAPPDPTVTLDPGVTPSGPSPSTTLAEDFARIRQCESSGDYQMDDGNGYYGAYQFSAATWAGLGGTGLASEAPPAVQDAAALRLYQESGWTSWPACAAILGLS